MEQVEEKLESVAVEMVNEFEHTGDGIRAGFPVVCSCKMLKLAAELVDYDNSCSN